MTKWVEIHIDRDTRTAEIYDQRVGTLLNKLKNVTILSVHTKGNPFCTIRHGYVCRVLKFQRHGYKLECEVDE